MNRTEYLFLFLVLLVSLAFRVYINYFIPINQYVNLLMIFMGLMNLILVFFTMRRLVNVKMGLLAALLYAISPWTAYLELAASPYIILLTLLLICFLINQIFSVNKKFFLPQIIFLIIIFLFKFYQITVFSNPGLVNAVNSFRGETGQTIFAPVGRVIENRYIYLSEHLLFNCLKQFTPATYFTNQAQLLGFSFTPPIYLGFIIPFLFGFVQLIKSLTKNDIPKIIIIFLLILPSILSKTSPDLSRLIIVSPLIFFIISSGLYTFILNYRKGIFRLFLFLTLFLVVLQLFTTLSDIAIREPVRLKIFLTQK